MYARWKGTKRLIPHAHRRDDAFKILAHAIRSAICLIETRKKVPLYPDGTPLHSYLRSELRRAIFEKQREKLINNKIKEYEDIERQIPNPE